MANIPKTYTCKYCGHTKTVTKFFSGFCPECRSRKAMVRKEKEPMDNTRLMNESERMKDDVLKTSRAD